MLNIDEIRKILKSSKLYVKENNKNFICRCCWCNDHRNPEKWGHMYVSKDESIPTYHCWLCGESGPITKLLFNITGKNDDKVIKLDKQTSFKRKVIEVNRKLKSYKLPLMIPSRFPFKDSYIQKRTFNQIDTLKIPNLIFDLDEFFKINNIDPIKDLKLTRWEITLLQHNFVVFLSKHHTMLYCRNINPETQVKFRKIFLQKNNEKLLDYYELDLNKPNSNTIILSEGNFDILGCYVRDSLHLNDKANIYASGCTFAYSELLKSVCYDRSIYNADVYILSDNDKQQWHYKNFIKNASMASSINIVYNRFGKDFGVCEQQAVKVF